MVSSEDVEVHLLLRPSVGGFLVEVVDVLLVPIYGRVGMRVFMDAADSVAELVEHDLSKTTIVPFERRGIDFFWVKIHCWFV